MNGKSRFTQLLERSRATAAYAIIRCLSGSFMYETLLKNNLWTSELQDSIIEDYVKTHGMSADFMEAMLYECQDDYWLTSKEEL